MNPFLHILVEVLDMNAREMHGMEIARTNRIRRNEKEWIVPSQSGRGTYRVWENGHSYLCSCPDCQFRRQKCKHIWAVEYWSTRSIDMEGNEATSSGMRVTYAQEWSAYNKAQTNEKPLFMELLYHLCEQTEQPAYKFGRPKLPISDMVFASVLNVYTMYSGRRFIGDLKFAVDKGYLHKLPHYNSVFNYLRKPEMTSILKDLITKSSLALKSVETDFAIDSTGFSTSQFGRWYSFKYGRGMDVRIWLKAHFMCGVKTNIITSVEVTEGSGSDMKQFEPLVSKTADNFEIGEVSADKAYSSRNNHDLIEEVGGMPFIPFRDKTRGLARGSPMWKKMWHYYNLRREEFLQHYHKRSNIESTVYMIKSKFGGSLRSKTKTAQVNELLAKVLCHNICVVIQEMHELGFMPNS